MTRTTPPPPVGVVLENWVPPLAPEAHPLSGRYALLEPLSAEAHAALLYPAYVGQDQVWDFLPWGPYSSASQFYRWVRDMAAEDGFQFFAIRDLEAEIWGGVASFLRINPKMGSIEIGAINFAPVLQRSRAATEALFLMMQWAFEAGYRRFEWKCDAMNMPSRRAAQRLGLSYEGIFRQAAVVKGRNRDTAWFAAIDREWPALQEAYRVWLDPANFDETGRQRERLSDLTRLVRYASDPEL